MVRSLKNPNQVRLAPADWGGLCTFALTVITIAGATLYKVHEIAQTNRERLAAVDAELEGLTRSVGLLQSDLRYLTKGGHP